MFIEKGAFVFVYVFVFVFVQSWVPLKKALHCLKAVETTVTLCTTSLIKAVWINSNVHCAFALKSSQVEVSSRMRLRAVVLSKAVQSQAACVLLLVELLLITLNTFKLSSALLCFAHILNSENVQLCTKHAFVCKCAGAAVVQAPEIQLSVNCNSEQDFFAIAWTSCIFFAIYYLPINYSSLWYWKLEEQLKNHPVYVLRASLLQTLQSAVEPRKRLQIVVAAHCWRSVLRDPSCNK